MLPIGGYFPKDKAGFLINPANWNLVPIIYQQFIYKLLDKFPKNEKSLINSVYLRGSLARDIDEKHIADIDLFALTHKKGMRWEKQEFIEQLIVETKKETGLNQEVEFYTSSYDEDLLLNYPALAAIIKTQSVCFSGQDFAKKLPKFKPGKSLSLHYRWLESDIKKAIDKNATITEQKNALKTLIRTGFEIVMERENEFTPDLYWCCKSFGKWYPEHANQMNNSLYFYLNANEINPTINTFLQEFGGHIVKESLKKLT